MGLEENESHQLGFKSSRFEGKHQIKRCFNHQSLPPTILEPQEAQKQIHLTVKQLLLHPSDQLPHRGAGDQRVKEGKPALLCYALMRSTTFLLINCCTSFSPAEQTRPHRPLA